MPDVLFYVATVWMGGLLAGVVAVLLRARSPFTRILAVDSMVLLVVSYLLVLAIAEGRAVFVDAAIAVALLGFATTVALVRVETDAK